jgi:error-prone DNA polymerase
MTDQSDLVYADLAVTTNFSFLRGASHPGDLVIRAMELGHAGIGIADRNSVAGVVRAYTALKTAREDGEAMLAQKARAFKLAVGARLVFCDGTPDILAYPENLNGWARLCRMLSEGKCRAQKGECILHLDDLLMQARDLLLIVMPGQTHDALKVLLPRLASLAPGAVWLAAPMGYKGHDRRRLAEPQGYRFASRRAAACHQ